MKRILWSVTLAVFLAASVPLSANFYVFAQVTIDATAGGIALPATLIQARGASIPVVQCQLRTAQISYLYVDPARTTVTSSVGTLLETSQMLTFTQLEDMLNFRAIRTTGSSGQLDCTAIYKS